MSEALEIIYSIYAKFLDTIFNQVEMFSGVYLGWVFVAVFLTGVMIKSIIALPRAAGRVKLPKEE